MRIEARLFEILTGFFGLAAIAYGGLTAVFSPFGLEWAGTTALVLTAGLSVIIGTFFRFIARRLDTRPEDYAQADIADGAGELGFFSPHSWWPLLIALGAVADLVVFDPDTIGCGPIATRRDLPGGEARLYGDAIGISHVIVGGVPVAEGNAPTGRLGGKVLRSGRDTATVGLD